MERVNEVDKKPTIYIYIYIYSRLLITKKAAAEPTQFF